MNDKEKKAIEKIEKQILIGECEKSIGVPIYISDLKIVLNIIENQKAEIEYYKSQKRYDDQFKHELLEEIRCKGLTIDSLNKILDDRLICIQGGRGLYTKLKGLDKEYLIREYLSMYKMCKQEIEKKDKIIDLMAKDKYENINMLQMANIGKEVNYDPTKLFNGIPDEEAIKIIKQYFEKKAEEIPEEN